MQQSLAKQKTHWLPKANRRQKLKGPRCENRAAFFVVLAKIETNSIEIALKLMEQMIDAVGVSCCDLCVAGFGCGGNGIGFEPWGGILVRCDLTRVDGPTVKQVRVEPFCRITKRKHVRTIPRAPPTVASRDADTLRPQPR
ncbi:MAG: hypothetical protein ABF241_10645 [Yoonia sp.]